MIYTIGGLKCKKRSHISFTDTNRHQIAWMFRILLAKLAQTNSKCDTVFLSLYICFEQNEKKTASSIVVIIIIHHTIETTSNNNTRVTRTNATADVCMAEQMLKTIRKTWKYSSHTNSFERLPSARCGHARRTNFGIETSNSQCIFQPGAQRSCSLSVAAASFIEIYYEQHITLTFNYI